MKSRTIHLALALCIAPVIATAPAAHAASKDEQLQPSTRDLYLTLIRQARDDGHVRAALAFLDDYDRTYPADTDAQILRINCLLDLDQPTAAQEAAVKLPTRKVSGPVHTVRGHVLAALGQWNEAIAEYGAALQSIPSDTLTNNAMGYAQMRAGQSSAAVETLMRARELAPRDPVIRNNLLLALTIADRKPEADALLARSGNDAFQADLRQQIANETVRLGALANIAVAQP